MIVLMFTGGTISMQYDAEAQPLTTSFADYLLVTATEAPPIELVHHTSPTPLNPAVLRSKQRKLLHRLPNQFAPPSSRRRTISATG